MKVEKCRSAFVLARSAISGVMPRRSNRYYSGPVSDHFDGRRFFNLFGPPPPGILALAAMVAKPSWGVWARQNSGPQYARRVNEVSGAGFQVTFIGHASFLVQMSGVNILIDPCWSRWAGPCPVPGTRRYVSPAADIGDLPPIDAILISHNHYDHLDLPTLMTLWKTHNSKIVVPLGNDAIIRKVLPKSEIFAGDWGDEFKISDQVTVHLEECHHWSARGLFDRRHALWANFVIRSAAGTVCAVGDSGFGDGSTFKKLAQRHPDIDIALLPIGAFEPRWFLKNEHMNPEEAVQAFRLLGAQRAAGHHWGTFRLSHEAQNDPPLQLTQALDRHGISADRFIAAKPGDVWSSCHRREEQS
jgi:L-ascorbate metabolism protein UlaG (beta-lactamase superfamily)